MPKMFYRYLQRQLLRRLVSVLCLAVVFISVVNATTFNVTPTNLQNWAPANVRSDASVSLSPNQPYNGNGSLMFMTNTVTSGQDKADFQVTWSDLTRTLGALDSLSYAFYRDSSSTIAAHFHPVLRLLFYDTAGTVGTSDDSFGVLVFEEIYQVGGSTPIDAWKSQDLMSKRFWMYISGSPGDTGLCDNFSVTLSDWESAPQTCSNGKTPPALSANTLIYGVNVGVGSGWGSTFLGYVDDVAIGFSGVSDTYNFEDAPLTKGKNKGGTESTEDNSSGMMPTCEEQFEYAGSIIRVTFSEAKPTKAVYCQILTENTVYRTDPGAIGVQDIIRQGVIQAVDIFGLAGAIDEQLMFQLPAPVCLMGQGKFIYSNTYDMGQLPQTLSTWSSRIDGYAYTCANIPQPGQVVLVNDTDIVDTLSEPVVSDEMSVVLTNCRVKTLDILNLRLDPTIADNVLSYIPYDVTLTATERTPNWFRVIYLDGQGWLSADFLDTIGACAIH